ncbi:ABC transporter permease [Bacillus sp. V3-13]|uniref:ABC transporter permease n=1 Tax=Bacillus sp. V3-13 TaxID=2053728 RepID=UPI001156FBAD|nr:ABC transporter permease [Bacillus sp. V3-13]
MNIIHEVETDSNSRAIFIVSYALWYFSLAIITEPGWVILNESTRGTIEQWWLSPYSFWIILFSKIIADNIVNSARTVLLVILILITTNSSVELGLNSLAVLLISLLGMYGIGFVMAGVALVYKRVQDIIPILQYLLLAVISLPPNDSFYAIIMPIYSTTILLKRSIVGNSIFISEYLLFVITSILTFCMGVLFFIICETNVRKRGTLGKG